LVNLSGYNTKSEAKINVAESVVTVNWPTGKTERGRLLLDLTKDRPLFKRIELSSKGAFKKIAENLYPAFILTTGKRDLVSQNGWNIFFDKVPDKPHQSYNLDFDKRSAVVITNGSRTIIRITQMQAASFKGVLEITTYNGSPLFNVAAVMTTDFDSTAILYDAGLVSKTKTWKKIAWSDTKNRLKAATVNEADTSKNLEVKYRTVIGEGANGSLAVFPGASSIFLPA
jgi:hypothetical protein